MKRFIMALALAAGLLACSESETATTAAGLSGTYDLTIVGQLVFVTSSDRDELRVLDLTTRPRDYVRAPNPLEPLSIPVLDRPIALSRDVHYGADGVEVAGPYVYARSAGSQEISVIGADPSQLREVARLVAPGLVTAIAARGPASAGAASQLYYATQSSSGAQVWVQELPGPATLNAAQLPPLRSVVTLAPGETVQALLALPPASPGQNALVIATRAGGGRGGRTVRVDLNAPGQFLELKFGAPVRFLATHGRLPDVPALGDLKAQRSREGALIFGILDESACGVAAACSGLLAVESSTGEVARELLATRGFNDAPDAPTQQEEQLQAYRLGGPMLPISVGAALPTGLVLAADPQLLTTIRRRTVLNGQASFSNAKVVDRIPLLGILPASNGEITLFNALELRQFDFDPSGAGYALAQVDAAGSVLNEFASTPAEQLPVQVEVVNGATRSDTYGLAYQGALPSLRGLTVSAGGTFEVPRLAAERAGVGADDFIVLESEAGRCLDPSAVPPRELDLVVTRLEPVENAPDRVRLVTATPLPEVCAGFPRFSVLAGGQKPFVLASGALGFLTRLGLNEPYTVPGAYYHHPDDFNPAVSPFQVRLTAQSRNIARGQSFLVRADAHYAPFLVRVNTSEVTGRLASYRLPASVVYAVAEDGLDYAYIAYPSADGILQMNLELIYFEQVNESGLFPFE